MKKLISIIIYRSTVIQSREGAGGSAENRHNLREEAQRQRLPSR